jgi:hypothetical protein
MTLRQKAELMKAAEELLQQYNTVFNSPRVRCAADVLHDLANHFHILANNEEDAT